MKGFYTLLDNLDKYLIEPEKPSLQHGDLWYGNFMIGKNNEPILIDPAIYYGHREADLALTELFGGFDYSFYGAYNEIYNLYGYKDRKDLYNLYHLLVHLNLFGPSYLSSCISIMEHYTKKRGF